MHGQAEDRKDCDYPAAKALVEALGIDVPAEILAGIDANRVLLLDHWARLQPKRTGTG